jgi:ABC transporter substrate binding protein (PQQ-dependent alcohol dehydrogenase system)
MRPWSDFASQARAATLAATGGPMPHDPPTAPRAALLALALALAAPGGAAALDIPLLYLRAEVDRPPVLSNLDPVPEDLGLAGAEVALRDTATTGTFLGHAYALDLVSVEPGGDVLAAARAALPGRAAVLVDVEDPVLLTAIADLAEAQGALLFNVASGAGALRSADCRANLLHTIPEDAALADALVQVLARKRWDELALVVGPRPADAAWAETLRTSIAKFGLRLAGEKTWTFDTDLRESVGEEIPRFLQDLPAHDVLIVADATDDFGRYIEHNTWEPRPVAGSDGLIPMAWSPRVEAWGAVQLQNRFEDAAGREMRPRDYAAWVAVRAVGEAVTRTGAADPAALRAYMLSDAFQLDGFKGRSLTFRAWNGQLRQPIPVANARALVAMAPVEGFLHQRNETDSLGLDAPESQCSAFAR